MKKIKQLTIKDLVKIVKWKEVKKALKYHYPDDKNDYEELFESIKKRRKVNVKDGEYIKISTEFKHEFLESDYLDIEDYNYYNVSLKIKDEDYSVSFIPWSKMISYPIDRDTLYYNTLAEIVAHFIWEITFYGNEKEMKKKANYLENTVKKIKDGTAKLVPMDGSGLNKKNK